MHILDNKVMKTLLTYLFLLLAAGSMHFYFVGSSAYFNETCCDSVKQVSHFYPFLQEQFSKGNFFWSWSNGLGGDLLGGFSYYYSTSPLFWLTMLFPAMETLREVFENRLLISVAKLFLAMASIYHLLRYLKLLHLSSIIGSLIYGGSIFYMFNSLRYDFMIDGMIYLPLLVLAFEYAVNKNRPFAFIGLVFFMATANFYLAFINSLYIGLYAILKYYLADQTSFKGLLKYMLRFMGAYFAGLMLAAFAFFPAVYAFLNVDRFYYKEPIPFFFSAGFYKELLYRLFYMSSNVTNFVVTLPMAAFFLLPLGFMLKDKNNRKRFLFAMLFSLMILIPFFYSLFNGLSARHYRWLYLFIFTIAWITAFIFDDLVKRKFSSRLAWLWMGLLGVLAAGLSVKSNIIGKSVTDRDEVLFCIAVVSALLLILVLKLRDRQYRAVAASVLVAVILVNSVYLNTEILTSFLGDPDDLKQRQEQLLNTYGTESEEQLIDQIEQQETGFSRIMWDQLQEQNAPMLYGYHGFSAYSSLMSGNIHRFMKQDYNVLHWNSPSLYQNLDNRLYLETALANKYYIKPKDTGFKPYGYSAIFSNELYEVYSNDYALPIGYLHDKVMSEIDFKKLSFAERDQLMLQAAVVEEVDGLDLPEYDPAKLTVEKKQIATSDIRLENASFSEEDLLIAAEGATLVLENPWSAEMGELSLELKIKETMKEPFKVSSGSKVFQNNGEGTVYNYPREQIVINAGNQQGNETFSFTLDPGSYVLEELILTFNPYSSYPEMAESKKAQSLENITYTERSVKGDIKADTKGILFLSVPYSKGWKVMVDGKKTDALEINSAFIGIPVSAGGHEVEIVYTTPYFKSGAAISLTTFGALILWYVWRRKKRTEQIKDYSA